MNSPGVGGEQGAGDAAQLHHQPCCPQVIQVNLTQVILVDLIQISRLGRVNICSILRNLLTKSFHQGWLLHRGGGEEAEKVKVVGVIFLNQSVLHI